MTYYNQKAYRVKSIIKTFRNLEVYENTVLLAKDVILFNPVDQVLEKDCVAKEIQALYETAVIIPLFIAESYGDRFEDKNIAIKKLEKVLQLITRVIVKLDFLTALISGSEKKEELKGMVKKYQIQRIKVLHLKKAWEKFGRKES